MSFRENYARLSDEELLMIAAGRADLVPEAALAIDSEMARRGLDYQAAHAKKSEEARLEYEEARRHRRSPKATKYFVAKMNGWLVQLLVLGVSMLALCLAAFHFVPKEWDFPILTACVGAIFGVSIVQRWLRRMVSFWLSLLISCTVQLFVAHRINVHQAPQSRNELKGVGFLSMFSGYAVGALLFLLIQKLKPKEEPRGDALRSVTGH